MSTIAFITYSLFRFFRAFVTLVFPSVLPVRNKAQGDDGLLQDHPRLKHRCCVRITHVGLRLGVGAPGFLRVGRPPDCKNHDCDGTRDFDGPEEDVVRGRWAVDEHRAGHCCRVQGPDGDIGPYLINARGASREMGTIRMAVSMSAAAPKRNSGVIRIDPTWPLNSVDRTAASM